MYFQVNYALGLKFVTKGTVNLTIGTASGFVALYIRTGYTMSFHFWQTVLVHILN